MNQCLRCGTATDCGQLYRFYFGIVVDEVQTEPGHHGKPVVLGPTFRAQGSEEAYYCDRCLVQAAVRAAKLRIGFFLALCAFTLLVAIVVAATHGRGLWLALVLLLFILLLGGAHGRRYRRLRRLLRGAKPELLRQAVSGDPMMQDIGDRWAVAAHRQKLQETGAQVFLTRREHELATGSPAL